MAPSGTIFSNLMRVKGELKYIKTKYTHLQATLGKLNGDELESRDDGRCGSDVENRSTAFTTSNYTCLPTAILNERLASVVYKL